MRTVVGLRLTEVDVVYLTDNGGSTCNYGSNGPLSGSKYTLAEGGIRVPFLIRWPGGGWSGGAARDGIISSMDLYPTLLAAAGVDVAVFDVDGVDQANHLRAGAPARHELHWECGFQAAVRSGDLKLRVTHGDDANARGIRVVEHTDPGDGVQLFDVRQDPSESRDLLDARPDDAARLWALHAAWLDEVGRGDLVARHAERVRSALTASRPRGARAQG